MIITKKIGVSQAVDVSHSRPHRVYEEAPVQASDKFIQAVDYIIKKAGIKKIRLHDLRHTHATMMLQANINPKIVSERLGHANIGITLDIYSHVLPGMQEAAVEKFDQIFEEDVSGNLEPDVGKMLAENGKLRSRPYRSRTCDTLIKSHGVLVQARKEVKTIFSTP